MSEEQALVNREAFENAGLYDPLRHGASADRIREELNCGEAYVTQMLRGDKPLSGKIRSKLDALIAAKANGPEPVEQFEVDLQAPQPMPRRPKYQVIKVFDGYAVVENPIAVFRGLSWAEEYAHWLNDQINRGKGGG